MEKQLFEQLNPAATTSTTLYQVPQGAYAILNMLTIATTSGATVSFRVSISKAGAVLATKDYIYYNIDITKKDTFIHDFNLQQLDGLRLESEDIVRVYATTNELVFNLFGKEYSI